MDENDVSDEEKMRRTIDFSMDTVAAVVPGFPWAYGDPTTVAKLMVEGTMHYAADLNITLEQVEPHVRDWMRRYPDYETYARERILKPLEELVLSGTRTQQQATLPAEERAALPAVNMKPPKTLN